MSTSATEYDQKVTSLKTTDVLSKIDLYSEGLDTTDNYGTYLENTNLASAFDDNRQSYLYQKNTDLLAQMNESWNTNRFIKKSLDSEGKRIRLNNKTASRDIYKMRHEQFQLEFSTNFYKCMVKIMIVSIYAILTILVVSVLNIQGVHIGNMLAGIIIAIVASVYVFVLVIMVKDLSQRRIMDWERYYWKNKGKNSNDNGQSCTTP